MTENNNKSKNNEGVVKKGDIVIVEFDGYVADTMELFDTSDKEKALKMGMDKEYVDAKIRPLKIVVGEGRVVRGLEEAIIGSKVGEKRKIKVPAEKGFGKRDSKLIKTIPISHFLKQKVHPYPGMRVYFEDGRSAKVLSINSGRVKVDMNHPLAGKELIYEFEVVKIVKDLKERVTTLMDMIMEGLVKDEEVEIKNEGDKTIVVIKNDKLAKEEKIIKEYLKQYLKDVDEIIFKG